MNETPTPRIARVLQVGRGASVAATVLACGALISACGSSKSSTSSTPGKTNLNTARVAHSIEQSILAQRHLKSKVVCPALVVQEQGRTFECVAAIPNAKQPSKVVRTPFVVTVQNSKGYVTYVGK
jgi:hypothetical protein